MMDSQRNIFIIALLFVSFMIWQVLEQDKSLQKQQQVSTQVVNTAINDNIRQGSLISEQDRKIIIKTDVLELTVNTIGGDIERALLLSYPKELTSNEPFQLLETTPEFIYQAQSGLIGRDGPDNPLKTIRPIYKTEKNNFILNDSQNEMIIPMTYTDSAGNIFIKTFTLKRGEYTVHVDYSVQNIGVKPLEILIFGQIKQSVNLPSNRKNRNINFALNTFRGAAYSTSYSKYEKYKFNNIINNEHLNVTTKGGWVAMLQQYFATAWIPNKDDINNFYTANIGNNIVIIGYKSQPILVYSGQVCRVNSTIWIGPEIQDKMAVIAPRLDLTVDYGWLWFISQPLFKLLKFIYQFLGNWGFSIIAITFIVRGIMYPLTKLQYTAIAKMRMLQPKVQAIRERLSNDKQRQSQEIIAIYKAEKVNPLGGCLPLLVQMPIFLALYYMLINSVELRHAPFALWIRDLSSQDPYYILPILMGVMMFLVQKISPTTSTDPYQQKIMNFMPAIFTIFFLWFPSGLVLYYIVSNFVTIIQQQIIYHGLAKHGLHNSKNRKI